MEHVPVLCEEIVNYLKPQSCGKYVDGTLGGGGHARSILSASQPDGMLLGLDVDAYAISKSSDYLEGFGERLTIMKSSYVEMDRCIDKLGWEKVNGIILDLGLSSLQLSQPERGFAFSTSGPLDMRFDLAGKLMAGDIVNSWSQTQIANILYEYGDERQSRRIAKALIDSRPIKDTMQLANIVLECKRGKKTRRHPATKTFQALRIAVNKELANIANVLPKAIDILAPGGRLAVIAFHSLEDRLVKRFFKKESQDCICPPEQISCVCRHEASVLLLNRRPIRPTQFEINNNRRSRSAVLRIVEKL